MNLSFPSYDDLLYKRDRHLPALEVLKLIAALLVMALHMFPLSFFNPVFRLAVPVFFIISGFFLMDSTGSIKPEAVKHSLKKILLLTLYANGIYFVGAMIFGANLGFPILQEMKTTYFWRCFLIYGDGKFAIHLWYLTAYLQALIIIYLAARFRFGKLLFILIPAGIILNLALGTYSSWLPKTFEPYVSRNVLTIALPCLMIGILLRRWHHRLLSSRAMFILFAALLVAAYAETFFVAGFKPGTTALRGDIVAFTVPAAACLVGAFLVIPSSVNFGFLARWGALFSAEIYIYHLIPILMTDKLMGEKAASFYILAVPLGTAAIIAIVRYCRRRSTKLSWLP